MIYDISRYEHFKERALFIISITSVIAALIGIVEYHSGVNIYSFIKPYRQDLEYAVKQGMGGLSSFRIKSSFDHAISFGLYLTLSTAATMYLYLKEHRFSRKITFGLIFIIIAYAIFLTQSRIAILSFAMLILPIFVLRGWKELFLACAIFLAFLVQPFFLQDIQEKVLFMITSSLSPFQSGTREMISSSQARIEQLYSTVGLVFKNPLFGYGRVEFGLRSIDNYYLVFALRNGLIALLTFIGIILFAMFKALVLFLRSKTTEVKIMSMIIGIVIVDVSIMLAGVSLESPLYLMWLYIGLLGRIDIDEELSSRIVF